MNYKYHNANPHKRRIDDCVIRAISILTNKSWNKVYNELSNLASYDGLMMDSVEFVEKYLDSKYLRKCHYSKTVEEFTKEFPKGKYAVTMNGHITAVIDGVVYDTFNPSNRIIRCSWEIK